MVSKREKACTGHEGTTACTETVTPRSPEIRTAGAGRERKARGKKVEKPGKPIKNIPRIPPARAAHGRRREQVKPPANKRKQREPRPPRPRVENEIGRGAPTPEQSRQAEQATRHSPSSHLPPPVPSRRAEGQAQAGDADSPGTPHVPLHLLLRPGGFTTTIAEPIPATTPRRRRIPGRLRLPSARVLCGLPGARPPLPLRADLGSCRRPAWVDSRIAPPACRGESSSPSMGPPPGLRFGV
jgi:hypothetical protein